VGFQRLQRRCELSTAVGRIGDVLMVAEGLPGAVIREAKQATRLETTHSAHSISMGTFEGTIVTAMLALHRYCQRRSFER
jgi:hypothetical protein